VKKQSQSAAQEAVSLLKIKGYARCADLQEQSQFWKPAVVGRLRLSYVPLPRDFVFVAGVDRGLAQSPVTG
jgi:hypothetical protein